MNWSLRRWLPISVFAAITPSIIALAVNKWPAFICGKCIQPQDERVRLKYIEMAGAGLMKPDRKGRTLKEGPLKKKLNLEFLEEINCTFNEPDFEDPPGGKTPKFFCEFEKGGKKHTLKIKYHTKEEGNDGIWGELLSTRLFWALGFPSDAVYPVVVNCTNCPSTPWVYIEGRLKQHFDLNKKCDYNTPPPMLTKTEEEKLRGDRKKHAEWECFRERKALYDPREPITKFSDAIVEIKYDKRPIEFTPNQGWSWDEFDRIDTSTQEGKINNVQREALALLSAFVQHADNKPEQQRLICLDDNRAGEGEDKPEPQKSDKCLKSALMIQDLGFSFGRGHTEQADSGYSPRVLGTASAIGFRDPKTGRVWLDPKSCVTNVQYFKHTGTSANKTVSEEARLLVLSRLKALTREDLVDLFIGARFVARGEKKIVNGAKVDVDLSDWIESFEQRVAQVEKPADGFERCPN